MNLKRGIPWFIGLGSVLVAVAIHGLSNWVNDTARDHEAAGPLRRSLVLQARRLDFLHRLELIAYDDRVGRAASRGEALDPSLGMVLFNDDTVMDLHLGLTLQKRLHPLYPRDIYAKVLRELNAEGAHAVAFDVLFSEERFDDGDWLRQQVAQALSQSPQPESDKPSPRSPAGEKQAAALAALMPSLSEEGGDEQFAHIIKSTTNTILAVTTNVGCLHMFRFAGASLGSVDSPKDIDGTVRRVRAYQDCEFISPDLQSYFRFRSREFVAVDREKRVIKVFRLGADEAGVGWESIPYNEKEEVVFPTKRGSISYPVFERPRVWHMGIVLAATKLGLDLEKAEILKDRIILRGPPGVEPVVIPVDSQGYFSIDWTAAVTKATKEPTIQRVGESNVVRFPGFPGGISYMQEVLKDDVLRSEGTNVASPWKGKLVVVGSVMNGNNMADIGATPLESADALVSTYPNVANSVLKRRFVHRWSFWAEALLIAGWTATGCFLTWKLRETLALAVLLIPCVGLIAVSYVVFNHTRLWLPVAPPVLGALALGFPPMVVYRVVFVRRQQQKVLALFSKLVSPNVVDELLQAERLALGGTRRELTVFFADIRGFTEMTDRFQAEAEEYVLLAKLEGVEAEAYFEAQSEEILKTVNEYLAAIADVVKIHGGTLDKYIGDCVMAFWGAPTANPNHAVDAVIAAVNAQQTIARLNETREAKNRQRETENLERAARGEAPLRPLPILALGSGLNSGNVTAGLMGSEDHVYNFTVFGRDVNLASRLEGASGRGRVLVGEATYLALLKSAPDLAALCLPLEPMTVKGFRNLVQAYEVPWRRAAEMLGAKSSGRTGIQG
ncbi:MAG TPA: CHASE2 domain-containing protein [Candidatus Limnocylindria bacterium]|nr:CHASE2 domain-containing protein [Candidatus Limnocylindria bacterium]